MDKGRTICKVLKDVRQKIATENGISYHPEECHHKGECVGTCPGCEKEIRYLEEQLKNKQHSGLGLKVAGIAAGVCVTVLPMVTLMLCFCVDRCSMLRKRRLLLELLLA